VQKVLDASWYADTGRIYGGYTIYYQSGGVEQAVFDASGAPAPRSARVVERIVASGWLPERGRLLDVGCGNGALLRSASERLPEWSLAGTELDDRYRDVVESIPHVEALYVGPPTGAPGRFDAITLLHVLEHVPSPTTFLHDLRDKLTPNGLIIIQVPEFTQNPFDVLIADHCTHFTSTTLCQTISRAGLDVLIEPQIWVPKELSVAARPGSAEGKPYLVSHEARELAIGSVSWLGKVLHLAGRVADHNQPFGIFGTSIAATWLASELGERVAFFVDEDPSRIGRQHLDRLVCNTESIPADAHVLIALAGEVGESVARRLRSARVDVTLHGLPPLP
jgi:SAM-dependent methyltransferase